MTRGAVESDLNMSSIVALTGNAETVRKGRRGGHTVAPRMNEANRGLSSLLAMRHLRGARIAIR